MIRKAQDLVEKCYERFQFIKRNFPSLDKKDESTIADEEIRHYVRQFAELGFHSRIVGEIYSAFYLDKDNKRIIDIHNNINDSQKIKEYLN